MTTLDEIREAGLRARFYRSAEIWRGERFIYVGSYSWRGLSVSDPNGAQIYLDEPASDERLGNAILEALGQSRFLSDSECDALMSTTDERYEQWVARLMSMYGYKSRRALLKSTVTCSAEVIDPEQIKLCPLKRARGEAWEGMGERFDVLIPMDRSAAEIGAAVRLALDRAIA